MGKIGIALSDTAATWVLIQRLEAVPLTLEEAAQIVAGCSNGNEAVWYELTDCQRSRRRDKARAILRAGVDCGALEKGAVKVGGKSIDVWELTRAHEIPY